ncbi:threonine-phosphate decarboxylase CobD [Thermoactinomyces mirandus]|uniref:threonine-phosphate decarboxylase n=1 Tax=Thermoactinomyces mirandus TaxID=2756294 RepID=A0A7W1XQL5_9BACL|nr:threonine-phosphate decarboxylase CobD [Thermoactinomyces mirandus]MBA4601494.1 threonine-phosphate decarboxylase [Thermoactinomyces mirandus]
MEQVEQFGHGGDLLSASELYGISPGDWIDFSSNIYPYGSPPVVKQIIREAVEEAGMPVFSSYPDPASRKLKRAIGEFHGVSPEMALPGNGAAELIDLIIQALRPARVGVISPAFAEYSECAEKRGIPVDHLVTAWEQDFEPETGEMVSLIKQVDLLFIGYPNNPTGHMLSSGRMEELLKLAHLFKTTLVVDEAFIDFVENGEARSLIPFTRNFPNLIVIRSMTKFFSLPGLRLGYLIAQEAMVSHIKKLQIPWSVNGLAQKIGCAVLQEDIYQEHARQVEDWIHQERDLMIGKIGKLRGFCVFPGLANYLLVRIVQPNAVHTVNELQSRLAEKGLLIRNCSNYKGLDSACFRAAIKKPGQNRLLLSALAELAAVKGEE